MDKSALLTERLPRGQVDIEGIGTITVRGLSRYELLLAGKAADGDVLLSERKTLAMALVDPEMTEADVEAWQKCSPAGEIMPVVIEINRLSGVTRQAQKEAYEAFRDEPGA